MEITAYLFMAIASFVFFGVPLGAAILFFVFLFRYISAKRKYGNEPEPFWKDMISERKTAFIAVSIISVVLLAIDISIIVLFARAMAYM